MLENVFTSSVFGFFSSLLFKIKTTTCLTHYFVKRVGQKQNPTNEFERFSSCYDDAWCIYRDLLCLSSLVSGDDSMCQEETKRVNDS